MNIRDISSVGSITLIEDVDGKVYGFSPDAKVNMTPRDLRLERVVDDQTYAITDRYSRTCKLKLEDKESRTYYCFRNGSILTMGPDDEQWQTTFGHADTDAIWQKLREQAKVKALEEMAEGIEEIHAKFPPNAVYVVIAQEIGNVRDVKSFWAVLTE